MKKASHRPGQSNGRRPVQSSSSHSAASNANREKPGAKAKAKANHKRQARPAFSVRLNHAEAAEIKPPSDAMKKTPPPAQPRPPVPSSQLGAKAPAERTPSSPGLPSRPISHPPQAPAGKTSPASQTSVPPVYPERQGAASSRVEIKSMPHPFEFRKKENEPGIEMKRPASLPAPPAPRQSHPPVPPPAARSSEPESRTNVTPPDGQVKSVPRIPVTPVPKTDASVPKPPAAPPVRSSTPAYIPEKPKFMPGEPVEKPAQTQLPLTPPPPAGTSPSVPVAPTPVSQTPKPPVGPQRPATPASVQPAPTPTAFSQATKPVAPAETSDQQKAKKLSGQPAGTGAEEKPPGPEILKSKIRWGRILSLTVPFLIGLVVGGSLAYLWFEVYQDYSARVTEVRKQLETAQEQNKTLEDQLEEARLRLNNVQIGFGRMNKLFNQMKQPPNKPRFVKTKDGLIVFWLDGMLWRHYHLYQGKGRRGELKKAEKRASQKNFLYLPKLKTGTYRFGVTALDREGKETEMSDILEIKYQP